MLANDICSTDTATAAAAAAATNGKINNETGDNLANVLIIVTAELLQLFGFVAVLFMSTVD